MKLTITTFDYQERETLFELIDKANKEQIATTSPTPITEKLERLGLILSIKQLDNGKVVYRIMPNDYKRFKRLKQEVGKMKNKRYEEKQDILGNTRGFKPRRI